MLSRLISERLIQLKVHASNWEEAIRIAAIPLLQERKITKQYIDKIIEIAREVGPYIVISKHIALPHAPANFGAKELAIGITTLKMPVVSGHEANDPVKYLFCLSAPDHNSHLEALSHLVKLLEDPEFYQVLEAATEPNAVLAYIKNNENKGVYENG